MVPSRGNEGPKKGGEGGKETYPRKKAKEIEQQYGWVRALRRHNDSPPLTAIRTAATLGPNKKWLGSHAGRPSAAPWRKQRTSEEYHTIPREKIDSSREAMQEMGGGDVETSEADETCSEKAILPGIHRILEEERGIRESEGGDRKRNSAPGAMKRDAGEERHVDVKRDEDGQSRRKIDACAPAKAQNAHRRFQLNRQKTTSANPDPHQVMSLVLGLAMVARRRLRANPEREGCERGPFAPLPGRECKAACRLADKGGVY